MKFYLQKSNNILYFLNIVSVSLGFYNFKYFNEEKKQVNKKIIN